MKEVRLIQRRIAELGTAADGRDLAAGRLLPASDYQGCCDWLVDLEPTLPGESDVPLPGLASPAEHQATVVKGADPPVWLAEPDDPADTWTLAAHGFRPTCMRRLGISHSARIPTVRWLAAESAKSLEQLVELLSKANDALARKLRPARQR